MDHFKTNQGQFPDYCSTTYFLESGKYLESPDILSSANTRTFLACYCDSSIVSHLIWRRPALSLSVVMLLVRSSHFRMWLFCSSRVAINQIQDVAKPCLDKIRRDFSIHQSIVIPSWTGTTLLLVAFLLSSRSRMLFLSRHDYVTCEPSHVFNSERLTGPGYRKCRWMSLCRVEVILVVWLLHPILSKEAWRPGLPTSIHVPILSWISLKESS